MKSREQYSRAYFLSKHQPIVEKLGNQCFVCGLTRTRLEIHHLSYPNGKPTSSWKAYEEADKNPENFRLLCHPCHSRITVAQRTPGMVERFSFCVEKFAEKRRSSQKREKQQ